MPQELSYTRVAPEPAAPDRWLYILHGIYGTGRNWGSLARRLVDSLEGWGVVLVDLRLHGASQDFAPPHTVAASADDVRRLEMSTDLPASAILGHSFGGKVALLRAGLEGPTPAQIWVADTTLEVREPEGTAWGVLEIVRGLPGDFASRDEVVAALSANGYEKGVGQWLAMNLEREGERFRWKLDWDGIEAMLRDFFRADVWDVIENPPGDLQIHVVRALKSSSLDPATLARLEAIAARTGRVHLHEVNAGHWLNVDNPEAVLELLMANL